MTKLNLIEKKANKIINCLIISEIVKNFLITYIISTWRVPDQVEGWNTLCKSTLKQSLNVSVIVGCDCKNLTYFKNYQFQAILRYWLGLARPDDPCMGLGDWTLPGHCLLVRLQPHKVLLDRRRTQAGFHCCKPKLTWFRPLLLQW
jgi:hypothetical protein